MDHRWESLDRLVVFRGILQDQLIKLLRSEVLLSEKSAALLAVAEEKALEGNVVSEYLLQLLAEDENPFSITAERNSGQIGTSLGKAVIHDLEILRQFWLNTGSTDTLPSFLQDYRPTIKKSRADLEVLRRVFEMPEVYPAVGEAVALLADHYVRHGYGDMARFKVFRWDTEAGLMPVRHPDRIRMEELIGYERQKAVLIQNTEAFINGRAANNVLLVGSRGTGKSSAVKALINLYSEQGLRLVEISKHDLKNLSIIMQALRERGKKFILFMDDLSFEEFEIEYRHLKSMMEGGVETKPDNVLIYATSNRRHLIKETWSDRTGAASDDLHSWDTINDKISLSDRFGITLTFAPPNQEEYLRIVESIAKRRNINMPLSELRAEAIKWEMFHSGRSGRLAQQFIAHIEGTQRS